MSVLALRSRTTTTPPCGTTDGEISSEGVGSVAIDGGIAVGAEVGVGVGDGVGVGAGVGVGVGVADAALRAGDGAVCTTTLAVSAAAGTTRTVTALPFSDAVSGPPQAKTRAGKASSIASQRRHRGALALAPLIITI